MHTLIYTAITDNIQVDVFPSYEESQSDIMNQKHIFTYNISISNHGDQDIQVVARHWDIYDENGSHLVVDGEGVVGEKPVIEPGATYTYNSYCLLKGYKGSMKGHYIIELDNGESRKIQIPKFDLISHLLN